MGRRDEQNRLYDQYRAQAVKWRKWYSTKAWRLRRRRQLETIPYCEPCKVMGKSRPANIVNHKTPHKGDRYLFFHGPLESCCKQCHDQAIQRAEGKGFRAEIDDDGWPADPAHPFNRSR